MNINIKYWCGIFAVFMSFFSYPCYGQDYIAVMKSGNIYDQNNGKYITENQNGDGISVIEGMVFKALEHMPGWYKIEYSPGLHAYIPEQLIANSFNSPKPGEYVIANNPSQKIKIETTGNNWNSVIDGKKYDGVQIGEILIFLEYNKILFSVVDLGNGAIAINYHNDVTNFF